MTATAVSARGDPAQLAYISVHRLPPGRYDVELESASSARPDTTPRSGLTYTGVTRGQLLEIVARHLRSGARG
jgi:hypothetical protein